MSLKKSIKEKLKRIDELYNLSFLITEKIEFKIDKSKADLFIKLSKQNDSDFDTLFSNQKSLFKKFKDFERLLIFSCLVFVIGMFIILLNIT